MLPQASKAKVFKESAESRRGKEGIFLRHFREAWPYLHLGFRLLVSRTVREQISVAYGTNVLLPPSLGNFFMEALEK